MNIFLNPSAFTLDRSLRVLTLGVSLAAVGLVAPVPAVADDAAFNPPTQNERSVALIEGADPANFPDATADSEEFQPLTPSQRAILLVESKEAPGGVLADGEPDWAMTANERSLAMTESKEAPGGILAGAP